MSEASTAPTGTTDAASSQAGESLEAKLNAARMGLLDLSARNRLLNTPRSGKSKRTIEIVDERSAEVLRLLVAQDKLLSFLPGRASVGATITTDEQEEPDEIAELAQPDDESVDERGVFVRHTDTRLQTRLTSKGLQKRLLEMYSDAITLEQEQGVNILFLALGMLKWVDPNNASNIRYAPLVLVPVALTRTTAADRFKLRWRHEEIAANLSLEAYLDREHRLRMPAFEVTEDIDLNSYFSGVRELVSQKSGWEVLPDDMVLGFFSFAKFLMYRDLDPECWTEQSKISDQPLIRSLIVDGFAEEPLSIPEDGFADDYLPVAEMLHVADADSSQMKAIHEARQGRSLVIQGPPGTGKSQTIANIIATAVADGKTVLFVAEKMVALAVVKSRLDRIGVGDSCLELHSNAANKRVLLQEIKRTWELGSPQAAVPATLNSNLQQSRESLNRHAVAMHTRHLVAGLTPFQVVGELAALARDGHTPVDFTLAAVDSWNPDEVRRRQDMLADLAQRIQEIGLPEDHPWHGVGVTQMLPTDVTRLMQRVSTARDRLLALLQDGEHLARLLHTIPPSIAADFDALHRFALRIASAPLLSCSALASGDWLNNEGRLQELLEAGDRHALLERQLAIVLNPTALDTSVEADTNRLAALPSYLQAPSLERLAHLRLLLPEVTSAVESVQQKLGLSSSGPMKLHDVHALLTLAESVSSAPEISPEAFSAAIWQHGLDRAADLADAALRLEKSRSSVSEKLTPSAWESNLASARSVLAAHGSSLLRHLSGEWRSANRLVRSFLQNSALPVEEVLVLLDDLAAGQRARQALIDGASFGREAFGSAWRDDRSSSVTLQAMVLWMRGLGGMRDEVRMLASRANDRVAIAKETSRFHSLVDRLTSILQEIEPGVLMPANNDLAQISSQADEIVTADLRTKHLFRSLPEQMGTRVQHLRDLQQLQAAADHIRDEDSLGKSLFEEVWHGAASDWHILRQAASWISANPDIRATVATLVDREEPARKAENLRSTCAAFLKEWRDLLTLLGTSDTAVVTIETDRPAGLQDVLVCLQRWADNPEQLSKWIAYRGSSTHVCKEGLSAIAERLADGRIRPERVSVVFAMAYYEALLRVMFTDAPSLAKFDGSLHQDLVQRFVELDRSRIAASAVDVVKAHHRRIPPSGGIGPVGVLRGETAKKTRHLPIRQLMHKAAPVIQALKPVFMMSPLSIAQFLPPGDLTFDLLVMDEASQIQPVDALGAIARCRQVIVVGDERQLPPTRFFAKMTSDVDEDEEDEDSTRVGDIESILGLFIARGLPQRMLRWHYRSRHQSLIAVSNSQFYENKLFVIPSPMSQEGGRGLQFQKVAGGIFYSESSSAEGRFANPVEARAVAEAVMRHAVLHPNLSLGVATFSVKQRRAIQDQIELLRRLNPETETFFNGHPSEPFFIKNLENVQGDERDVIFISVGYGRDPQGKFALRFGPLGMEGGERRLNVLISRAKLQCVVYASITDEDIDPERIKSKGVFALRLFLHFARTGRLDMVKTPEIDRQRSVFLSQAAVSLRERGYVVHEHVGLAGCFVDLALIHPDFPGQYVLGIETDGPSYASAQSSRDRDRLRREVLEGHGWVMHRVWSLDWLHRPQEQLTRCIAAAEQAKEKLQESFDDAAPSRVRPIEIVTIEREHTTEIGLVPSVQKGTNTQYVESRLPRPTELEIHEAPTDVLASCVCAIVEAEGPIHEDEVVVRLRSIWGLQRSGNRIQSASARAIQTAKQSGRILAEGPFVQSPNAPVIPRDRSGVRSLSLRQPEMLPTQEIRVAVITALQNGFGGTEDEIVRFVAKCFGFHVTSTQLRLTISQVLREMHETGVLSRSGELFHLLQSSKEYKVQPAIHQDLAGE